MLKIPKMVKGAQRLRATGMEVVQDGWAVESE